MFYFNYPLQRSALFLIVFLAVSAPGLSQDKPGDKQPQKSTLHSAAGASGVQPETKGATPPKNERGLLLTTCLRAGTALKKCQEKIRDAVLQCTGADCRPAPDHTEPPAKGPLPPVDLSAAPVTHDTTMEAFRIASNLREHGLVTLAAEYLESIISKLQRDHIPLNRKGFPGMPELFHTLASLPLFIKNKQEAQQKIQQWLDTWPVAVWQEQALEVLVVMLANAIEVDRASENKPTALSAAWLDSVLGTIDDTQARDSIRFLVYASATDDPDRREQHLRNAILTGYSHPLPYLMMIAHLQTHKRHTEARRIYDIYKLAVLNNTFWHYRGEERPDPHYLRLTELRRLETLFVAVFKHLDEQARYTGIPYSQASVKEWLEGWPESSRDRAEDMLLEKVFQIPRSFNDLVIKLAVELIILSRQRWLESGNLESQAAKVQDYIATTPAPVRRQLPFLHEYLALLLANLGREQEAADLLYNFGTPDAESTGTVYDLSLFFIAVAHDLHRSGEHIQIPPYHEAYELVMDIIASGYEKALDAQLKKIRREIRTDKADIQQLHQLYWSISEQFTRVKPGGPMGGSSVARKLKQGLAEAFKRAIYSGPVPDLSATDELNTWLIRNSDPQIQERFTEAFEDADIERITGLYLEAVSIMNGEPLRDEAIALQWLAFSKWLALNVPGVPLLDSPEEALAFVQKASGYSIGMKQPMEALRNFTKHRKDSARSVKRHYLRIVDQIISQENQDSFSSHWQRNPRVPFDAVFPNYTEFNVPMDGLCMYHALSEMYDVSSHSLLGVMRKKLLDVYHKVQNNLQQNHSWTEGLSTAEQQMILPIVHLSIEGVDSFDLQEMEYTLNALEQAINYLETEPAQDQLAPPSSWGTSLLLNTAAIALSEFLPETSFTPFVALLPTLSTLNAGGNIYEGESQLIQYNPDGTTEQISPDSIAGQPLLIHSNGDHWMFALPVDSSAEAVLPVVAETEMSEPEPDPVHDEEIHNNDHPLIGLNQTQDSPIQNQETTGTGKQNATALPQRPGFFLMGLRQANDILSH